MDASHIAFEFVEHCTNGARPETVIRKLAASAASFGFDRIMLAGLPSPTERFEQFVVLNSWPKAWYERFTGGGYFHCDSVGQWAMRTGQPFTYDEVPDAFRMPCKARRIRAEAKSFGLADGLVVPIRSIGHRQSVLSFSSGFRSDLGPQDRAALHLIAIYAENVLVRPSADAPARQYLTMREREVLAWVAEGKSAWETSAILSLSERTVTKHLEHIRAKLKVVTTAQAVAEALRCGELTL